jgi:hypothetical protein
MNDIINADSTQQTGTQYILHEPKEAIVQTQSPFDINALFSAAILNAVNAATAPLVERINALQHSATTDIANLTQRIELLERSLVVADKAAQGNESDLSSRLALLEDKMDNISEASDQRIKEIAEEVAEAAFYEHNDLYDHDEYDRFDDRVEEKVNDAVSEAIEEIDFEEKVRDIMRHASVSIDI